MKKMKLAAMIVITTILAAALSLAAMAITTRNWAEPIDLGGATAMWAWLAFFHLVVFMLPLTLALEPNPQGLRGLYYAVASGVALIWTILLDGPEQPASYAFALLAGLAIARCWTMLLKRFDPWETSHA